LGVCLVCFVAVFSAVLIGFILRGMGRGGSLAVSVGRGLICWVFEVREGEKVGGVFARSLVGLCGV
jgi:hypothetical protein